MEEIAEVYGRALFEAANEAGRADVVREQLGELADAVAGDRELQVFLFSPYFSTPEKKDGLRRAVQGADELVANFLELLVEKHRMPAIFRIRRHYDSLWEREHRVLPVQIATAIPLDDGVARRIGDQIADATGRRVELTATVDPEIIAGVVLRVGNSILDASIRNRLENLRKAVARGAA